MRAVNKVALDFPDVNNACATAENINLAYRRIIAQIADAIDERALNPSISFRNDRRLKASSINRLLVRRSKHIAVISATDRDIAKNEPVKRLQRAIGGLGSWIDLSRVGGIGEWLYVGVKDFPAWNSWG